MIKDLEKKIKGEMPVSRRDLIELVNSWGRSDHNGSFNSYFSTDDNIKIPLFNDKEECYPLENLDVSQIKNFGHVFYCSLYNGDLSKWNMSFCTNIDRMFSWSYFNNDSLKDWDVSHVEIMGFLFYKSKFNSDISKWDVSNVKYMPSAFDYCPFNGDLSKWKFHSNVNCQDIFCDNKNFKKKYNNNEQLPNNSKNIIQWIEDNRLNIANVNLSKKDILDMDNYLESFNLEKRSIDLNKY